MIFHELCYDPLEAPEHRALAIRAASEGMVLLETERHLLPFDRIALQSIAVIGPNTAWGNRGGCGSSKVQSSCIVTPLETIMKKVSDTTRVKYN